MLSPAKPEKQYFPNMQQDRNGKKRNLKIHSLTPIFILTPDKYPISRSNRNIFYFLSL